ncbi:MAG: 2-dehydropantoate 2-reductase [Opitutales bacterium]
MTNQARPRIAIVGTGAIGGFYGCLLARAGEDVHFLCRSDYAQVRAHGLRVTRIDADTEDFALERPKVYSNSQDIGPCDLVVIATKTTANDALPALLEPLLQSGTVLLSLQNGMGNLEFLQAHFPGRRIVMGLCFVCVNRTAPGVFENTLPGGGRVVLSAAAAEDRPLVDGLTERFNRAEVACKASHSLDEALWRKLCWNIPFNGLAIAAGGVTTDVIMGSERLRQLARLLMDDVCAGAAAHGHRIEEAFLQQQFEATARMGAYHPSSLLDYLDGRPVELETMFEEPLRRGQAKGAAMPHLETLCALLRALVQNRNRPSP